MTVSQVWLAQATFDRLRTELTELLRQRGGASLGCEQTNGRDDSDQDADQRIVANRRDREHRIRALQELLDSMVGEAPPDNGIAEPGMLLMTVRYHEDQDTETFLLAHREENTARSTARLGISRP